MCNDRTGSLNMANESAINLNVTTQRPEDTLDVGSKVWASVWCVGLGISCVCGLLQASVLTFAAKSRHYDQILLTQITLARILNSATEFCILNNYLFTNVIKDAIFTLCFHTDFVLVCFMFLFSKNLYNKVVLVFTTTANNLAVVSTLIWLLCLPIGLICPYLLKKYPEYFIKYWRTCAFVKFVILIVNAFIFVEIFSVAFRRGMNGARTARESLKAAAVAFLLVFVTSIQVFFTDLMSMLYEDGVELAYCFGVINSFQALPVTIIFITIAKNSVKQYLRCILIKLRGITV